MFAGIWSCSRTTCKLFPNLPFFFNIIRMNCYFLVIYRIFDELMVHVKTMNFFSFLMRCAIVKTFRFLSYIDSMVKMNRFGKLVQVQLIIVSEKMYGNLGLWLMCYLFILHFESEIELRSAEWVYTFFHGQNCLCWMICCIGKMGFCDG